MSDERALAIRRAFEPGPSIILARLLLEMQGATLVCTADAGAWTARIEFPGRV